MTESGNLGMAGKQGLPVTTGPARGTLLIHGGTPRDGQLDGEFRQLFRELAGGPRATSVYIPTAASDDELGPEPDSPRRASAVADCFGFHHVPSILHTRDRKQANTEEFVRPLKQATAAFIEGGRQPRLADVYLNTRTHRELESLLERGGVIAGTSAGATILGSFMVRNQGAPDYDPSIIVDWRYETRGFGFIKNAAIDQHVTQRHRQRDLLKVLEKYPQLLGIGIDENTSILVQGDEFTVIGQGGAIVSCQVVGDGSFTQLRLRTGDRYNLRTRQVI